jgi:hypothetical protein
MCKVDIPELLESLGNKQISGRFGNFIEVRGITSALFGFGLIAAVCAIGYAMNRE